MGFKLAEQIGDINDDVEVIQSLLNDKYGFKEKLNDALSGDWLVVIVQILTKICETSFTDSKLKIFQNVFIGSTYSKQLTSFISNLPNHSYRDKKENSYFWKDTDKFWNNLLLVFEDIVKLPSFASQNLPKLLKAINRTFPAIEEEHNLHIADDIKEKFEVLLKKIQSMKTEYAQATQNIKYQCNEGQDDDDDRDPPNDFREISVYPDVIEVTANIPPFLRKNKIRGSYSGVLHYLDVQFRLLREDFIAPLRRGICQYLNNPQQKRYDDVRIYPKIQFLSNENVNELNCLRIKFDFANKKKCFKYENSKLFMFGSLVCFTKDKFRSLIFGKIVKRDIEILKMGELIVGFDDTENISFNTDYIMVESSVYFEPYYHVLVALQRMSLEQFPMERYIIYAEAESHSPKYLHEDVPYIIENHQILPLFWPIDERRYGLNDSQHKAFKAALTQEIAVIQGPPGTGKTFLGLKIAKTLLRNKEVWYKNSPILVICYTNHALDQFLEGILPYTKNLLRIGGQSKNENLNKYNLRNIKHNPKSATFYQTQRDLQICLSELKSYDNIIGQILHYNSIIDFSLFDEAIPNFRNTWFYSAEKEDIINWLFVEVVNGKEIYVDDAAVYNEASSLLNNSSDSEDEGSEHDNKEEFDEVFNKINLSNFKPLISLESIASEIKGLESQLYKISHLAHGVFVDDIGIQKIENEILQLKRKYKYLESKLEKVRIPTEILNPNIPPQMMSPKQRWATYASWLQQYCQFLKNKGEEINIEYKEKHKIYSDQRDIEDVKVMREKLVIGMTTTGAARLRNSLEALRSPIVIVEEAAEVLEAHIISALTVYCQHLILIGDHKQLKPSTADYKIETDYLLGVSLFERMVNNNLQCYILNVQHRMKPRICNLIRPAIYPDLKDDQSVSDRPNIHGVEKDLFFINHNQPENSCDDSSKKNIHEAKFLINLARYLILNGYEPKCITILAAYLGQMFEMQKERKKHSLLLRDIKIAVLDNYQGEESDIILLSLVRNNKEGKVGFLKIENRVCVALSRARNGLYIMGNMDMLTKDSSLWRQINQTLVEENAIGTSLSLRCIIHEKVTNVECEEDFVKVPEGGCNLTCGVKLICGHTCKNICHLKDRDHNNYKCLMRCERRLCDENEAHICNKRCFENCGPCSYPVTRLLPCKHSLTLECHIDPHSYKCNIPVPTKLDCGHTADKPCHIHVENFKCPHPCDNRVEPCGHACILLCHVKDDPDHLEYKCSKPCAKNRVGCTSHDPHICRNKCHEECEPCEVNVKKKRTVCSHVYVVPCNSDVDEIKCEKPCTEILTCGHKCRNKCFETCGPCKIQVEKIIPECGHKIKISCWEIPARTHCKEKCTRKLVCGHTCVNKCKEACTTVCEAKKACNLPSPCGHIVKEIKCHETVLPNDPSLLKYCTEPCNVKLKCNHKCKGTCGKCFQGRIHQRCDEKCGVYLVCNHECPIPCREACKPCEKNCSYRCKHSSCKKKCGDICIKCTEQCPRKCKHQKCTNPCGDICSIEPCQEPCGLLLKCGHPCIGFCNDPCPRKCRICDKNEITEVLFGTEDEEDAVFVELQDCKHVLESTGMETWLRQDDGQIQTKVCPKCKTPIINTQRYSDYVKRAIIDINNVKQKLIGSSTQNNQRRMELLRRIDCIKNKSLVLQCDTINDTITKLEERLQESRSVRIKTSKGDTFQFVRQRFNGLILDSITSKIQILEYILDICCTPKERISVPEMENQIKFILNSLLRDEEQITVQEIEDIELEISRLRRIVEICQIKNLYKRSFLRVIPESKILAIEKIEKLLVTFSRYTKDTDDIVQSMLKNLNTIIPISETERREIVKALGLSRGHWFKCPNGHPYVITECGGAMQEFTCPECGERIGGTSHTLLSSNQLAPEMDGASFPAWSELANMQNYRL